jgi:hypothetical protein
MLLLYCALATRPWDVQIELHQYIELWKWKEWINFNRGLFSPMGQQPLVGQGLLIIEISRSHSISHISLGRTPWTSGQPVAENSTSQHTTLPRDRHACPRQVSNQQSQQGSGRRPTLYTARPLLSAHHGHVLQGLSDHGRRHVNKLHSLCWRT